MNGGLLRARDHGAGDRMVDERQLSLLPVRAHFELVLNNWDARRADFVAMHFHRQPSDVYQYDLLLNSSFLGEELCADLIARAAQAKLAQWSGAPNA